MYISKRVDCHIGREAEILNTNSSTNLLWFSNETYREIRSMDNTNERNQAQSHMDATLTDATKMNDK